MNQFNFSSSSDNPKMFLVRKGEINNRIDAEYYDLIFNMSSKSVFPLYPIGTQFYIKDGDHNKFPPEHSSDIYNGVRYLRSQDLKDGEIIDLKPIFVSKEYFNTIKRSEIRSGYILFSIMASVGSVVIYPENREPCTANRAVGILVPKKNNKILPRYFRSLFNTSFGEALIQTLKKGGVQQRINLFDFSQLKIPIPPFETQVEIASFFDNACHLTKQKEQQAQALLAGIDAYLLAELDIALPQQDNSLEKRIFTVQFKAASGQRLDPIFFNTLDSGLFSSKYDYYKLSEIAHHFKSGFGVGRQDQVEEEHGIIQIRPTNINALGELIFHKNVYVPIDDLNENNFLRYGDVLFNNTNSQELVGKTSLVDIENQKLTYSNHITVIRTNQNALNPVYLQNVLNLYQKQKYFYSICTNWNNQSGIGVELLKSVKIPVPTIDKQNDIVLHIQDIRLQAKQLQTEAAQILADAKVEVERMILGE